MPYASPIDFLLEVRVSRGFLSGPLRSWHQASRSRDDVSLKSRETFSSCRYAEQPRFLKPTTSHQMGGKKENKFLFWNSTAESQLVGDILADSNVGPQAVAK